MGIYRETKSVDTIAFRFCWTIIRTMRGFISDVKCRSMYKKCKFLYIFTLFIHPSTLNITNKTPHSPDDGSAEPKRYSVDRLCFSINPHFLFGLLVVNFSSQIVGLLSIIFFHIYIYIYTHTHKQTHTHTHLYFDQCFFSHTYVISTLSFCFLMIVVFRWLESFSTYYGISIEYVHKFV